MLVMELPAMQKNCLDRVQMEQMHKLFLLMGTLCHAKVSDLHIYILITVHNICYKPVPREKNTSK